jgi:hypothetical protein
MTVDPLRTLFYSSTQFRRSHVQGNQFDLVNPDYNRFPEMDASSGLPQAKEEDYHE